MRINGGCAQGQNIWWEGRLESLGPYKVGALGTSFDAKIIKECPGVASLSEGRMVACRVTANVMPRSTPQIARKTYSYS